MKKNIRGAEYCKHFLSCRKIKKIANCEICNFANYYTVSKIKNYFLSDKYLLVKL